MKYRIVIPCCVYVDGPKGPRDHKRGPRCLEDFAETELMGTGIQFYVEADSPEEAKEKVAALLGSRVP